MKKKKKRSSKHLDKKFLFPNQAEKWRGILRFMATRNIALITLGLGLILICTNTTKLKTGAKIRLNQFSHPESFRYLNEFLNGQKPFKRDEFFQYQYYYEQALGRIPEPSAIKTVLAYCHYVLGDYNLSAKFYNQALADNPKIFWPFYNLALMSYQVQKYDQASMILKEAVGKNPHDTLVWLRTSENIYKPILKNVHIDDMTLLNNLRKGYGESYILLIASFYYQSKYQDMLAASLNALKANIGEEALLAFYAGAASYLLQNYQTAVGYLNQSIEADPAQKISYYYLGLSHKALGNQKLYQSTLPQWSSLMDKEKNIAFSTEYFKIRLY